MRKLLWPVRIGIVALGLVLLPAEASDGSLARASLCAADTVEEQCRVELMSYCAFEGQALVDRTQKGQP